MTREMTCIVCPKGCTIKIELEGKDILSIEGHTCKRGEVSARNECVAPMRTLTTTAAVEGGGVVAVKSDNVIPKELLFKAMEIVNSVRVPRDAALGSIVVENILGTGANIVTTALIR